MGLSKSHIRKINKFHHLSAGDKFLLSKSFYLLIAVRVVLHLVSFQKILQRIDKESVFPFTKTDKRPSFDKIAWAVETVGRYIPGTTCLYKALASKIMLAQYGYDACIHIGVDKKEAGSLDAHAWVEIDGHILIGGARDLSRYTPLLP